MKLGLLLHEEILLRSWLDSGYLAELGTLAEVTVFIDRNALNNVRDLPSNIEVRDIQIGLHWQNDLLGKLSWQVHLRRNSTLAEKAKFRLYGYGRTVRGLGVKAYSASIVRQLRHFFFFALGRSPVSSIAALLPLPGIKSHSLERLHVKFSKPVVSTQDLDVSHLVIPTREIKPWLSPLLLQLRRLGISSTLIPDNWDNLTSKNGLPVLPDRIVTMGQASANNLSSITGIPSERLLPIGLPKFHGIKRSPAPGHKARRFRRKPKILYLGLSLPYLETQTINRVFEELVKTGLTFDFTYKPHPHRDSRVVHEEAIHDEIEVVSAKARRDLPDLGEEFYKFLASFDIVVSTPTTLAVEFLVAGRAKVIFDGCDDMYHRTTPKLMWERYLHVRDLVNLGLPKGDSPEALAGLIIHELLQGGFVPLDVSALVSVGKESGPSGLIRALAKG